MTRYKLDGQNFPTDPIIKRPTRQQVATQGTGQAIYNAFWQYELSFPFLETQGELEFLMTRWLAGGLHTATLPHPKTGTMTGFTGVNIADVSYELIDVDNDGWAASARMLIDHVNLSATGTV